MRKLKIAAGTIGALLLLVTLVGFAMPRKTRVERSVVISAPEEAVYPFLANLKDGWSQWHPMNPQAFPDMKLQYEGPAEGVGAKQAWSGESSRDGSIVITRADPKRGVEVDVVMMQESYKSTGQLLCEPASGGTRVTWTNEHDNGANPYARLGGALMGSMMGKSFDQGLAKLKSQVESKVATR